MKRPLWLLIVPALAACAYLASRALSTPVETKEVPIPAGPAFIGCNPDRSECSEHERTGREIHVDAFYIDLHEVTVEAYGRCVRAFRCAPIPDVPDLGDIAEYVRLGWRDLWMVGVEREGCNATHSDRQNHPINCVDWSSARDYCAWVGGRLPTELEWEKAARGTDGRPHPWGDAPPSCSLTVMAAGELPVRTSNDTMQDLSRLMRGPSEPGCGKARTWPVLSKTKDVSPFGVFDTGGNVSEWVAGDDYPIDLLNLLAKFQPVEPGAAVTRGGNMKFDGGFAWKRWGGELQHRGHMVGFRCARSAD